MKKRKKVSPRYIGPKIDIRLPQEVIDWYGKEAADNEMTRADYIREVLMEHWE